MPVDKLPHLLSTFRAFENPRCPACLECEKVTGSFSHFASSQPIVRCNPGAPAGKGSPHDSAWIMLHCTRNSLNLSKASQFGSTLAGERPLRVCTSGFRHARLGPRRVGFWFRRLFWVSRRHVVVFSARMRKIFPFGVPRGALTVHGAPSKLSPICKSPGRALRVSGERESPPFQPAPNGNILRIRARFPARWPSLMRLHLSDPSDPSRRLSNVKGSPRGSPFRIGCWFVDKRRGSLSTRGRGRGLARVRRKFTECGVCQGKRGQKREADYGGLPKERGSNERSAIAAEGLTPPHSMPYCTCTTE